jgi:hypothetical protein
MGGPLEELGLRFPEDKVVVLSRTQILLLANILDARISRRILLADIGRAVCGSVIRDNYFEIAIRLGKKGIEALLEEILTIVDRKADTQPWGKFAHVDRSIKAVATKQSKRALPATAYFSSTKSRERNFLKPYGFRKFYTS